MAKGMRIKDVGATINLGNYSSLHVTIGEESEYAGLDIGRAQKYLMQIADSVGGVLNLPKSAPAKKDVPMAESKEAKLCRTFKNGALYYDNESHQYMSQNGVAYTSVTQLLENFYPFNADGVIKQAYMDFAANFGNLIHTSIQNSLIGYKPKKDLLKDVIADTLKAVGDYEKAEVEEIIELPQQEIAGRFDAITYKDKNSNHITLWDVKTNSDIYASVQCTMSNDLRDKFMSYWNVDTTYGEHCLQLNIYAYILENVYGMIVDDIKIIYIPDGFKEIIEVPKVDITPIFEAIRR